MIVAPGCLGSGSSLGEEPAAQGEAGAFAAGVAGAATASESDSPSEDVSGEVAEGSSGAAGGGDADAETAGSPAARTGEANTAGAQTGGSETGGAETGGGGTAGTGGAGNAGSETGGTETGGTGGVLGGTGNVPSGGSAGAVAVGDAFQGGIVTGVTSYAGSCSYVVYELPPVWECDAAALESEMDPDAAADTGDDTLESFEVAAASAPNLETSSCSQLADVVRSGIRSEQEALLFARYSAELSRCNPTTYGAYVENGSVVSYCSSWWGGVGGMMAATGGSASTGVPGVGAASGTEESDEGASEYTTTNNQVVGVEEADYVKNDSGHIFVLTPNALKIFDTWPVVDTVEIARVPLTDEPRRMLLAGDRLVVFLRTGLEETITSWGGTVTNPSSQGCTYGYDCRYSSEGGSTRVEIYDVADPSQPALLKAYALTGAYVASRRINEQVYLVVHDGRGGSVQLFPELSTGPLEPTGPEDLVEQYGGALSQLDSLVAAIPEEELLPQAQDSEGQEEGCAGGLFAAGSLGTSLLSLVSFDVTDPGPLQRTFIAAEPGFVYASANALYVATDGSTPDGSWYAPRAMPLTDISTIHKFALLDGETEYRGSAPIRGHVLNQFAMDEREGVLRVASTSGWVPNPDVTSTVTTLVEQDGDLARLGELTGLAPTEDIRSVRFDGTRGFVVTFKKTDPLFVFDLTDPAVPVVQGELKIPGYSTYMHPIDEQHLLAIGFDADDHDTFAYFDGIQVQMFDVTNLSEPVLLHKVVLGTRGSGSEALLNHLAFTYFAERGMLAMPVTLCEGGDDGYYGTQLSFTGVVVFDVSVEGGITERGRLPFANPIDYTSVVYYDSTGVDVGCYQWWSSSTSTVKRTIFFEDYLFGLSDAQMRAGQVDALDEVLVDLSLAD